MTDALESRHYRLSAYCILFFVAVQTFQELGSRFWIPEAQGPEQELLVYLLTIDRVRALLVLLSIILLVVPYTVIAVRYAGRLPVVAIIGFTGMLGFVGFEILHRSVDYFVVGRQWATALEASGGAGSNPAILAQYVLWSGFARGLYFPLMLSYMGCSIAFFYATMRDKGMWARLASFAFALNALRLLARMTSTYGGATWLDPINNTAYFPFVFVINSLLATWLFHLAGRTRE
ncbi:hypothetical protein [Luteibacter yeojuensis]|uniref:Uncharacterized protein n=1 Tax=Luteibacter yeojuensis TaxID=345309 RepID=A0A7X5QSL8_9GAMM|nr:hypothetical protein [Luteibacter yeojuensis]NID14665.1 hypothetical protein [Luteibacter yeojuensis]